MITVISAASEKLFPQFINQLKLHQKNALVVLTTRSHNQIVNTLKKSNVNTNQQFYINTTASSTEAVNAIPFNPDDLTGLSIAITQIAQTIPNPLVIFDNFTALSIRVPDQHFARFIRFIADNFQKK